MSVAKSYDIRKAISCDIAKEAEVAIEAPSRIIAEVVHGIEFRMVVVLGNNDSITSKSDDVAPSD
jgi:FAD synthase